MARHAARHRVEDQNDGINQRWMRTDQPEGKNGEAICVVSLQSGEVPNVA